MTDWTMTLRGIAIPYNRTRLIGAIVESVAPGAFAKFVASGPRIAIRHLEHDGPILAYTSALFEGPAGLYFEASAPLDTAMFATGAPRLCATSRAQASVYFTGRRVERDGDYETVIEASIDHVTICDGDAAYGRFAPVWRVDDQAGFEDAPWAIEVANAEFEEAWLAHDRRQARAVAAARSRPASSARGRVPPAVAAALRARQGHYAEMRAAFARALVEGRAPAGMIMAHAAFSRGAGFDGNFNALMATARKATR